LSASNSVYGVARSDRYALIVEALLS